MGDSRFHLKIWLKQWGEETEKEISWNWSEDVPDKILEEIRIMFDELENKRRCPSCGKKI